MRWDPEQYGRYAGERGRPFVDLLARIGAHEPRTVVDLGCGPGNLTVLLAERWPSARVFGIDSSPEMIDRAREIGHPRVSFELGDVVDWVPPADADVVVSNATLQWVPEHAQLLSNWCAALRAGSWLAWQVPNNFGAPSHTILRELAESAAWTAKLGSVLRHRDAVLTPASYAHLLLEAGWLCDVWQTTYLHLLEGPDAVLEWLRGTGLRPALGALDAADPTGADSRRFQDELAPLLRVAYPRTGDTTIYEFERTFAVATKPTR